MLTSIKITGIGLAVAATALLAPRALGDLGVLVWSLFCSAYIIKQSLKLNGEARRAFLILGIAGAIFLVGIVVRSAHGMAIGVEQPFPSPADLFHVPGYLLFLGVAWKVYRARADRHDTDAWLDAAAFTIAIGSIAWAAFLGDFVLNPDDSPLVVALHLNYNLLIFATLAVVVATGASPGLRTGTYYLLGAGSIAFLVADLYATWSTTSDQTPYLTIALSPLIYGFCAAAVAHPSAQETVALTERAEYRSPLSRAGFIFASMLAPTLVVWVAQDASDLNRRLALLGSFVVALLLSIRMFRLLKSQSRSRALDRRLIEELGTLATHTSSAGIVDALPRAARRLLDPSFFVKVGPESGDPNLSEFQMPAHGDEQSEFLCISPALMEEQDKRRIHSLLNDACHLATAIESNAELARQRSAVEMNRRIAVNEQRFRALVQNASDLVMVISEDETVAYMSEAAERVTGYPASEFEGRRLEWVIHPADWETARNHTIAVAVGSADDEPVEIRTISPDGSNRLFECELTDMRHIEGVEGVVINATDVTDRRKLEIDLYNAATTDSLTLLLNRQTFTEEADTAVRRGTISKTATAVAILNLDEFGFVNGSLGQAQADQVLIEVGHAIRRAVRIDDSVARLNGDEFAILMPGGYGTNDAVATIERVIEEISKPIEVAGQTVSIGASAGLVVDADPEATGASLLRNADTAMDLAKHHQRGTVVLYDESMGEEASERIEIRNSLENSIDNGELRLVYQPIVNMETGEITSMESLSRWHHPVRGPIAPDTFIPIAESSGFIETLGDWVFETVCQQVNEWDDQGIDGFTVSVNMSGHQLRNDDTTTKMRRVLKRTGADPSRIVIEITESVLIDDTEFIADRLRALREMGLKLAIDDFGTGYSSLSYLQRYEFDVLKIDRSFVRDIDEEKNSRRSEIIRAIVSLAKGLGAVTVAEGVEDNDERQQLAELGCDLAQGYLFYYPMELPEMNRVLATARDSALAA